MLELNAGSPRPFSAIQAAHPLHTTASGTLLEAPPATAAWGRLAGTDLAVVATVMAPRCLLLPPLPVAGPRAELPAPQTLPMQLAVVVAACAFA